MKTAELTGWPLDWAVAKAQDLPEADDRKYFALISRYSCAWSQGGPIIEREKIELIPPVDENDPDWMAVWHQSDNGEAGVQEGHTPLIAAMRCYVTSKLGDEVEVPEELS